MPEFKIETNLTTFGVQREIFEAIEAELGFVPNVYGVLAGVPSALNALVAININFEETSFTAAEREVISLTTSVFNQYPYCVAGHSTFALKQGVDKATVDTIRKGGFSENPRLQALGQMTLLILKNKGNLGAADIRPFLNAGFRAAQILELLVGIAGKTMTNFASKIARVPLDEAFVGQSWVPSNTIISTTD